MGETFLNIVAVLGIGVMLWLLTWLFAAVLITPVQHDEVCESGAQREFNLRDWHMVGPWPIATDYSCGGRS